MYMAMRLSSGGGLVMYYLDLVNEETDGSFLFQPYRRIIARASEGNRWYTFYELNTVFWALITITHCGPNYTSSSQK